MKSHLLKSITLLYIEDDLALRQATVDFLALYCDRIVTASDGVQALELFAKGGIDVVLTDIRMPHMDGLTFAAELKHRSPQTPLLFYTAFTEIPYLIKGIELGITGFVQKPTDADQLLAALERAALPVVQQRQLKTLQEDLVQTVKTMLGSSDRMTNLAAEVISIAHTDFPVLIQGETGTGKSRLASLIHELGARAKAPFVTVQLGAIPEALIPAELFGYEKGAFTGADRRRDGRIKSAASGTLFLDDIDAAPPSVQGLLLQFVEEKSFTPLGSNQRITVDLRIITASNRDLSADVNAGQFRRDLFYRLAGLQVDLPPLRAIPDDIAELSQTFLRESCQELGRNVTDITPEAITAMQRYQWPGNIRELRNVIRRLILISDDEIRPEQVKSVIGSETKTPQPSKPRQERISLSTPPPDLPMTMDAVEKWALQRGLQAASGKKMVAARLLDMNYYTFRRRLARLGLDDGRPEDEI